MGSSTPKMAVGEEGGPPQTSPSFYFALWLDPHHVPVGRTGQMSHCQMGHCCSERPRPTPEHTREVHLGT